MNQRPQSMAGHYKNHTGKHRALFYINHSNIFFYLPPRVMEIIPKTNIWDLIKLMSFCTAKETIKKKKKDNP